MPIENRPLNEFELDCIVNAQMQLRKDPIYMELLEKKRQIESEISKINYYGSNSMKVLDLMGELRAIDYQMGFWQGKTFVEMAVRLSREKELTPERLAAMMMRTGRDH